MRFAAMPACRSRSYASAPAFHAATLPISKQAPFIPRDRSYSRLLRRWAAARLIPGEAHSWLALHDVGLPLDVRRAPFGIRDLRNKNQDSVW